MHWPIKIRHHSEESNAFCFSIFCWNPNGINCKFEFEDFCSIFLSDVHCLSLFFFFSFFHVLLGVKYSEIKSMEKTMHTHIHICSFVWIDRIELIMNDDQPIEGKIDKEINNWMEDFFSRVDCWGCSKCSQWSDSIYREWNISESIKDNIYKFRCRRHRQTNSIDNLSSTTIIKYGWNLFAIVIKFDCRCSIGSIKSFNFSFANPSGFQSSLITSR